ncbi:energy coupling factor transporter S component ThiW [Tepidibacillus infernus]|uniref:energy coupling factor transporter S component ThiW n=1 Tax=Tepidibacillus infernus TaxID=1806172 RepID=UPI003B70293F
MGGEIMKWGVKQLTLMAMLVAIGTITSTLIWFPAGIAKAYPMQHAINVISAVVLNRSFFNRFFTKHIRSRYDISLPWWNDWCFYCRLVISKNKKTFLGSIR